ncbi:putative RNA-directed DNA polymerase [Helianthus annuus]|nr:putative RNA-directed DNA polymerase [Helianthus annuus]
MNGIGGSNKSFWVRNLKSRLKADVIGLQETHKAGLADLDLRRFWDNSSMQSCVVDSVGRSGGLALMWNPDLLSVDFTLQNQRFVLVSGSVRGYESRINILNVHAPNEVPLRKLLWLDISELIRQRDGMWVCFGDFNEVRDVSERVNSRFDSSASEAFNDFIYGADLLEYPVTGDRFTYVSGHSEVKMSKLDRFLVNEEFLSVWPLAKAAVLDRGASDHRPISLSCNQVDFGPIPFKFFNTWLGDENVERIVHNALASSVVGVKKDVALGLILKCIKEGIKKWRKDALAAEDKELKEMKECIRLIESKAEHQQLSVVEKARRIELRVLVDKLERSKCSIVHQKARVKWLRFGDENSSFFHTMVKVNMASNRINGLVFKGILVSDPADLKAEILSWFKKQFSEPINRRPKFSGVGLPKLSFHGASILDNVFSESEVWRAIKDCNGGKAPGPDGFTLKFFKVFWNEFKPIIMGMFSDFFSSGCINKGCNSSFVALIPKSKDPQELSNFRPISLVGSIYKIIAKVLANRLKAVLREVVSQTQCAFVGGRNILDSPLIISEAISWAKKNKAEMLIFKVDFEKAYDSINWKFLLQMLSHMDFPVRWISWIKGCLRSGMGSVLVNGSPTSEFKFKRGLRQGDPLSPFLFIIAMEVINLFLNRAMAEGLYEGFQLPNGGPTLSHLCYADDVLFIGRWSAKNVVTLTRLLRWIGLVTGLKINNKKCKLFGIGVNNEEVTHMAARLKCEAGVLPFMYLGVPIGANMKRAKHWEPVVNRVGASLSKWKARHLSFAGRLTLAKSVLGSIPSYYLSLFSAPKCIINKIDRIRRDFIWGISDTKKKFRWIKWESMLRSKKSGGLGVGRIADFNLAMLTKWWWRFKMNPNHLWARVIASIHNHNQNNAVQLIPVSKSLPGVWKDIGSAAPELFKRGLDVNQNLVECNGCWKWRSSSDDTFSVKQLRCDLEKSLGPDLGCIDGFEWNNWAPPKANYLLWRATLGKIACRVGLMHRGIALQDVSCPRCGLANEDSDHIFINCLWAKSIWWNVLSWVRIQFPVHCDTIAEFMSYVNQVPGGKVWKKLIRTIVMASVWRIWSARNSKIFEDKFIPIMKTVELVKEDAFLWITNRSNLNPTWSNWRSFDTVGLL